MAIDRNKYDPQKGSEYGGVPGLIQPPPHELTAKDKLKMLYQTLPEVGYIDGQNPIDIQEVPEIESA
jgi:hypothetical protein